MKKIFFVVILLVYVIYSSFSDDNFKEYIVLSNNVKIRDNPSINSNIIREVSFPEVFTIYEITGTGIYNNGILDKWARISNNKSEWINYFFISSFPFVISGNDGFFYGSKDYNTIIIHSIFPRNNTGNLYFSVHRNSDSFNDIIKRYHVIVSPTIEGIKVIDNAWTRLFNFCDNFFEYVKNIDGRLLGWKIIIEDNILLDYGIHIGMNINDIINILGIGFKKKENSIYIFEAVYNAGFGSRIYFYTEENIVTKIIHEMVK